MNHKDTPPTEKPHHRLRIIRHIIPDQAATPMTPTVGPQERFRRASQIVTNKLGSPTAFGLALLLIIIWVVTGPFFNYSDTWQLVINTATTIVTFLMVFAIQNSQNRDARAMQLKLNELINTTRGARMEFVDLEDLSDGELDVIQDQFKEIYEKTLVKQAKSTSKDMTNGQ